MNNNEQQHNNDKMNNYNEHKECKWKTTAKLIITWNNTHKEQQINIMKNNEQQHNNEKTWNKNNEHKEQTWHNSNTIMKTWNNTHKERQIKHIERQWTTNTT